MISYTPPATPARLPVIDLGGLASRNFAARKAVAREVHLACRATGFFYVANHGVPAALVEDQLDCTRRFFSLPPKRKEIVHWANSSARRGYEGGGRQVLDSGSAPDLKESFYIGRNLDAEHPYVKRGLANHGPNQWPADQPGFRAQSERYFAALLELSNRLMSALALSLDLPEDWFAPMLAEPMPIMRLIHYPPQAADAPANQFGAGAHTDWGALTLLAQDEVGGLDVQGPDGRWIRAAPIRGTFVVNLGDMIARWTNGLYHSTVHRVLNAGGRDRYSVAFFANPDHEARVECLPTCTGPDKPPRFPPCTAGEHIEEMYRLTFAERRAA